jgi:hypothetical protein
LCFFHCHQGAQGRERKEGRKYSDEERKQGRNVMKEGRKEREGRNVVGFTSFSL